MAGVRPVLEMPAGSRAPLPKQTPLHITHFENTLSKDTQHGAETKVCAAHARVCARTAAEVTVAQAPSHRRNAVTQRPTSICEEAQFRGVRRQ